MLIGTAAFGPGLGLDALLEQVRAAEAAGLDSVYFTQQTSWDALTLAALAGREVPRISLGTGVVRTYPVHPLAMAGQALTAQAATGGRLTLGLGPSHREVIESQYGMSFDRPARHVREYLEALGPLLRGEAVQYRGETLAAAGSVDVPGAKPPSVLLSALGPVMLRIAGELTDGTVTTWAGPQLVAERIVPGLTRAAEAAGRPAPRVLATLLAAVTSRPAQLREELGAAFGAAGEMASYRRLLDLQGLAGPQDTAVAGDEAALDAEIRRFADAGVTELLVLAVGDEHEQARTRGLLADLVGRRVAVS
jgi:F420-dependent oxidoreductase-like protein